MTTLRRQLNKKRLMRSAQTAVLTALLGLSVGIAGYLAIDIIVQAAKP
jgi:hypothetical protein